MLDAEADILALDLDCFQLLQGYRQAGLAEKAQRAKESKKAEAEAKAAEAESAEAEPAEESIDEPAAEETAEPVAEVEGTDDEGPQPPKKAKFDVERSDPWIERICELESVESEHLCVLHGKLIAAGFLNFQIRDRHTGIEYRVANAGKQYLTRKLQHASEEVANAEGTGEEFTPEDVAEVA